MLCSVDGKEILKDAFDLILTRDDEAAAVTKCGFYRKQYLQKDVTVQLHEPLGMGGGGYVSFGHFSFIHDPSDGVPKLFNITLPTKIIAMPDVLDALTDKFGSPSSVSDGTVQNGVGATFPQKTYRWSNGVSSLVVEGPFSEVDDMVVIYTLDDLQSHVQALIDAKKRGTKNRM